MRQPGARLDWILAQCYSPQPLLGAVHTDQLFGSDVLLIAGYWLAGSLILIAGWWRYETATLRRASWVILLPTFLAVADLLEDILIWCLIDNGSDGRLQIRSTHFAEHAGQWVGVVAGNALVGSATEAP